MNSVSSAVVLAGGLGTRLRSVVSDVPKPMAPIGDKPFLAYELDYWIQQGIKHFVLSVGYLHGYIMDFFGDVYQGAYIDYVIEESPLGSGGALLKVLEALQPKVPLLLLNGDTYFKVNLAKLGHFAASNQADMVFAVFHTDDHRRYMPMDMDTHGRIVSMPASHMPSGRYMANGGVNWMSPVACDMLLQNCPRGVLSLDNDVFPRLFSANARLYGLEFTELFIDIGLPNDYVRFQQHVTGMESHGS